MTGVRSSRPPSTLPSLLRPEREKWYEPQKSIIKSRGLGFGVHVTPNFTTSPPNTFGQKRKDFELRLFLQEHKR